MEVLFNFNQHAELIDKIVVRTVVVENNRKKNLLRGLLT